MPLTAEYAPSTSEHIRNQVELQDGPAKGDYLAWEVTGEETAVWWERSVAAFPDYAGYQEKTDCEIPCSTCPPCPPAPS